MNQAQPAKFLTSFMFVCIVLSIWIALVYYIPNYNLYLHQANAFLNFSTSITQEDANQAQNIDISVYQNRLFVPFPPFPALLVAPFVKIFGAGSTNLVLISVLLTVISVFFLVKTCQRNGLTNRQTNWLCAAFFLGTGYWSLVLGSHETAYFAHTVSTLCLLGCIYEIFNKQRGWVFGLWAGAAFLCRQFTSLCVILLIFELIIQKKKTFSKHSSFHIWLSVLIPFCIIAILYLLFNYMRFGNPFDTGYSRIIFSGWLAERIAARGLFNYSYIRSNLYYFLLQPPLIGWHKINEISQILPNYFGTALTFASPFLAFAIQPKWRTRGHFALWWAIIGLVIVLELTYHNNGWRQINTQRFSMDYIPLLVIPLMHFLKTSVKADQLRLWKFLVVFAISLNVFFLVFIPIFNIAMQLASRLS